MSSRAEKDEKKGRVAAVAERGSHLKAAARRTYLDGRKNVIEEGRIVELLPMVRKIAMKVVTYLKPPLTIDDLVSAGTIGLVKAARDYDASFSAEFKTYAYTRIKGAILDELRNSSELPAEVQQQIRNARKASWEIFTQTGRTAGDSELAARLEMSIDQLYNMFEAARAEKFLSIDGFQEDDPVLGEILSSSTDRPGEQMERTELVGKLSQAIAELPEKQRQVIVLYYQQELTMKQIAEVLNVSEPRVSQIHSEAIFNLMVKLEGETNG